MLPELYHQIITSQLTAAQYITLKMLVNLIQTYKNIQIEKIANHLPLPIKSESRRRHLQRWLKLEVLTVANIWHPIIKEIIKKLFKEQEVIEIIIDRTQWGDRNIFMVGVKVGKRSLPVSWQILNKKGSSNLSEQQEVLKSVLTLLKNYQIIVIGDKEFHSAKLGEWLKQEGVRFILRQKKNTKIRSKNGDYQRLEQQTIQRGKKYLFANVEVTLSSPSTYNIVIYWRRKYQGKGEEDPWYLLTNLDNKNEVVNRYKNRMSIEAMFKDYKTGGYNLESAKMSGERLEKMLIVLAIAYTISTENGTKIKKSHQIKYIERARKIKNKPTKNSNFWIGIYGENWAYSGKKIEDYTQILININRNKRLFYLKGLKAKNHILSLL